MSLDTDSTVMHPRKSKEIRDQMINQRCMADDPFMIIFPKSILYVEEGFCIFI